jgi:ribosome-associated protein
MPPDANVETRSTAPKERALPALRSTPSPKDSSGGKKSAKATAESESAKKASAKKTGLDPLLLAKIVETQLDEDKAEDILNIPLAGKSPMADAMIVASGRSARHVSALADHVARKLKEAGVEKVRIEGMPNADWVLIDAGDIIVHIFRPEVREFYNLERIWSGDTPSTHAAGAAR